MPFQIWRADEKIKSGPVIHSSSTRQKEESKREVAAYLNVKSKASQSIPDTEAATDGRKPFKQS